METELKNQQSTVAVQEKTAVLEHDPLSAYGGYSFLENIIDGFSNLNPERKARYALFLADEKWESERRNLLSRLNVWLDLLKSDKNVEEMRDAALEKADIASESLKKNLKTALKITREIEESYWSVALFYKNTESDKVKNVTIVNADKHQIVDLDNTLFIDYIANEFKQNFDRLDLKRNYSILVVPGYMGSNAVIEKWSKIAYENKAILLTDFQDLETPDDVMDIFLSASHAGGEVFKTNTLMTCNWLLGRPKEDSVGEEENVYVPPSSALAGRIYNTLMSQVVAGKKFGGINEVENVRFDLKKSEISELEKMGLVPMVNEYSKVMAFSAKTLFNGDNLGLQTYSVVRVFDYITKVMFDFLNRRAFENWTSRTEADLRQQIVKFLDSIQGPTKLIERFKVMKIEQDRNQKDRILLDIHITPYFPA
ncbi:MAG: type VI secretion system contractile sheath protein TssC, partial [Bacteroidota bacterium]